jgi:hypothetical protein
MIKHGLIALCVVGLFAAAPSANAFNIDFEGLPAGLVVYELTEGAGVSGGLEGSIGVLGFNPFFGLAFNTAIIFDSSNPTGFDDDLGTPNEAYAGPGIGAGGATNDTALGNLIIIAEDLQDLNGDDLIDDPDDADHKGSFIEFDLTTMGKGGKKTTATVNSVTFIDIEAEQGEDGIFVELSGPDLPVNLVGIPATGDNGKITIDGINLPGVALMRVNFNGSGAFAGATLNEETPGHCWFTFGGFQNAGIQSGGKDFTFGGNVGPPASGSMEVVDHNTGDNFHTNDVWITDCYVVESTGPGQPGGKKGFVINAADFAGTGRLNGEFGFEFTGMVIDAGEPGGKKGKDKDFYEIIVTDPNNGDAVVFQASGYLDGGNVQLHPPVGNN